MKKIFVAFFFISSLLASCSSEEIGGPNRDENTNTTVPKPEPDDNDGTSLSGMAFTKDMGVGWNLGNTLDAPDGETSWGNPITTKAMIDVVAKKGFKTMRIPVTWRNHLGEAPNYTIDKAWLDRVETIASYALQNDMYVIINIHHDEEIISPTYAKEYESTQVVKAIWSQVAKRFKDYDDRVIFEVLNEMRVKGSKEEWQGGTEEGRNCINKFNAAGVEAIRNAGGKNDVRKIMLSPYAASATNVAMEALEIPKGDKNIIVAVHSYAPYNFCQKEDNPKLTWGTKADKDELDYEFANIKKTFIDKGYPVVLGEWGSKNNNNTDQRAIHAAYYAKGAIAAGICPIVWDDGGNFKQLNRQNRVWYFEDIVDAIVSAVK